MVPAYDVVTRLDLQKGNRALCSQCLNAEMAEEEGLDKFEHIQFEPVELTDSEGAGHIFHFRTHLFGPGVALDAFELRDGREAGYRFQVIGDPKDDLLVLLGRLIEKIRRGLSRKHVEKGTYGLQIADHQVVRGTIDWDDAEDGRTPLLIVDGRGISWDQFGHMLMSYEGWQFKLEIRSKSDEV